MLLPIAPVDAVISTKGQLKEKHLGKAPGRYSHKYGDWTGLGGNFINSGVKDQRDQDEFAGWPTPNVGILGCFAPAIDSDAESEDARRLVERVVFDVFGRDSYFAERRRGKGPRRLYAFKAASLSDEDLVVRGRHVHYRMPGEDDTRPINKIDVMGAGNQYLIAGEHQSGDWYEWDPDYDLYGLFESGLILEITNADIARFLEAFEDELTKAGGTILHSSGGSAPGEERDYSGLAPTMPPKDIFDGLQRIPNNERNFPDRDSFVKVLAAIRAALGAEAEANEDHVEAWATAEGWADREYFDKAWRSLDRAVRVDRDALNREFKRHGVFVSARVEFAGDADEAMREHREAKAERRNADQDLFDRIAARYVFGHVNTRTGDGALRMRSAWDASREWRAIDWWNFEAVDPNRGLLLDLQESERYPPNDKGFWNFANDFDAARPDLFYTGETKHPHYDRGEIVEEHNPDGSTTREINMRYLSPVIRHARRPAKDQRQAREDSERVQEFIRRVFGELADYELDTLAYMAQTGNRPGHMLFLVGEKGVGKSIYSQMLIHMFDGIGREAGSQIDGTKMTNEAARRFALAKVEGCRIISVKELPDGASTANMAAITSSLKQLVDAGPDGDYIQIEAKGKDSVSVRNFARIVSTSNYRNAVQVEENDRRIFYVVCLIDLDNKPDDNYYSDLTDVTTNSERLAAFWRYLLTRDVSGYVATKVPPLSRAKREAVLSGMTNPLDRHMTAALETFRQAHRWIFDIAELAEVMSAMSENEHENSGGGVDDRKAYDFGTNPSAVKRLDRVATKVAAFRTKTSRLPPIYAFRTHRPQVAKLEGAERNFILETLDRDREDNPLSRDHVFPVFAGPVRPTSKRQR